jgi:hypothetical protein
MNRTLVARAFAALAIVACDSDPAGPDHPATGPGTVALRLTVPRAGPGALVISVSGGPVDSISTARGDLDIAWLESAPNTYGVLVRGPLRDGLTIRLSVPDRAQAAGYLATITQAVDGESYERLNLTGYAIALAR